MPTTNKEREMRIAQRRVEGFAQQFGEAHRNLARHAAFPLVLTPDLLYQIWANFVPEAPWTAVAHVLLSRLCRQVGYEMYEMDIGDRNLLLRELKEEFGQERFDELGEFLLDYVAQRLTDDDADTQDLREAQEWTALAYTKPDETARELAQALSHRVQQEDMGEVLRLASLVETLAEPLVEAGFEPLLVYSRGMESFVRGDLEGAKAKFSEKQIRRGRVKVAAIDLILPRQLLINVDERGKFVPTKLHEEKLIYPKDVEYLLIFIQQTLQQFALERFYDAEDILHTALLQKAQLVASGKKIENNSVWFRRICTDIIRKYSGAIAISDWTLLHNTTRLSLEKSLKYAGLNQITISRYILAWKCFQEVYIAAPNKRSINFFYPESSTWQTIAELYNARRFIISPKQQECNPETLEDWLRKCAKYLRLYKYPSVTSLNLPITTSTLFNDDLSSDLLEYVPDSDESSPDVFVIQEESKNIQQQIYSVLEKVITQFNPQTQQLLQMYYGKKLPQKLIARELNLRQAGLSRQLYKIRELLLHELIKWSEQTLNSNSSINLDLIKQMDEALVEWLYSYYATKS